MPRNGLLEQGYKSVGDWHSTQKSGEEMPENERDRWAGNAAKTECGLHEDYFKRRMEKQVRVKLQSSHFRGSYSESIL